MSNDPPVFPGRIDPSDRFRERRRRARRRRQIRRLVTVAALCGTIVALALNARFISGDDEAAGPSPATGSAPAVPAPAESAPARSEPPDELRGVHVTMALASIPARLEEYVGLAADGLNAIEVDVKDESGEVAFVRPSVPLARKVGASQGYYDPRKLADRIHAAGLYLIGRVVVFEDPKLALGRSELAIRTRDGAVWRNDAGLGWTNPYDRRVWEYNVAVAEAAARAGFDEIMFDYVRFPSDGNVAGAVYYGKRAEPRWKTIAGFLDYASERLRPLGVRVSAAVFGLSATRDLGIGQRPRKFAPYLDTIYPMVYPSHYNAGEYNIPDPGAQPGLVVSRSLLDFRARLEGTDVKLVPWLQDFSLGRSYSAADVVEQVDAARRARAVGGRVVGFMLWNAGGEYSASALAPG